MFEIEIFYAKPIIQKIIENGSEFNATITQQCSMIKSTDNNWNSNFVICYANRHFRSKGKTVVVFKVQWMESVT